MSLRLERVEIAQDDWRLTADIELARGSATAVIGPSGAGKSTLLAAIAGFLDPARGSISWDGRDLTPLPPAERPVTLLFQEHNLFPQLSAARNVGLGLRPDLRLDRAGWERVDAALARALLRDRPVLMLDEPFAALGPALRAEMLDLVDRIRAEQGATLLMVSHQPEDALRIAQQTVMVADGVVHPPAPTAALLADPPPALRDYLGRSHGGTALG